MMNKYINLLRNIYLSKMRRPYPFSGVFWITDKCNSKCKICGIWKAQVKNEMQIDIFEKIFKESKLLQRLSLITFTGGEPFLKDDLPAFVEAVNRYSSPLNICFATNGLSTDKIISLLSSILMMKGAPINIKLSLDGIDEVHNEIRGIDNSFQKSMNTLSQMLELKSKYPRRLSISIGFTATSLNYHQMPKVAELSRKNNVEFFYKPVIYVPQLRNDGMDKSLFLSRQQKEYLASHHYTINEDLKRSGFNKRYLFSHYLKFLDKYYKKPMRYIPCYALLASFHVSADWKVFSCLEYNGVIGDLKSTPFDELFRGKQAYLIREQIKRNTCHCLCTGELFPSIVTHKFPLFIIGRLWYPLSY